MNVPGKAEPRTEIVQIAVIEAVQAVGADHGQRAVGRQVGDEVVLFAHGTEVLPAQAQIQREVWRDAVVVLGKEAEAVVVSGAARVASGGQDKGGKGCVLRAAGIEVHQRVDDGIGIETIARRELEDATLHVVVEVLDGSAPKFSAELDCVFAVKPGEVVEELVGLAGATAGYAEADGAEIFDASEIEFGQAQLACAEVQTDRRGIEVGVQ